MGALGAGAIREVGIPAAGAGVRSAAQPPCRPLPQPWSDQPEQASTDDGRRCASIVLDAGRGGGRAGRHQPLLKR